ncbi:hypothetical protein MRB53_019893 [Persea americana]|uniref:Uncharacterized protein n=1 Tax=Persea americana TaxID=3435 RepID=A0ACC2L0B4_PERAE|nr:hypothetical protein MRB53_019893 [Persea americana]
MGADLVNEGERKELLHTDHTYRILLLLRIFVLQLLFPSHMFQEYNEEAIHLESGGVSRYLMYSRRPMIRAVTDYVLRLERAGGGGGIGVPEFGVQFLVGKWW